MDQDAIRELRQFGVHPKNWTEYVRVMTGSWSPEGEKGSCHEKPQKEGRHRKRDGRHRKRDVVEK
jgi:hypothetical protein